MSQWTESVIKIQDFGLDGYINYKIMVQNKNGIYFFVWYPDSLDSEIGDVLIVTFSDFGSDIYWEVITNPKNGRESKIAKILQVN